MCSAVNPSALKCASFTSNPKQKPRGKGKKKKDSVGGRVWSGAGVCLLHQNMMRSSPRFCSGCLYFKGGANESQVEQVEEEECRVKMF